MSKLDEFLLFAEQKVGTNGSWSWRKTNSNINTPWCAQFISSCAKSLNLTDIIPEATNAQDICDKGISSVSNSGTYLPGNVYGLSPTPQTGDIVLINNSSSKGRADSVSIVKSYDKQTGKLIIITGDSRNAGENRSVVALDTISENDNRIQGYFRPDWNSVE